MTLPPRPFSSPIEPVLYNRIEAVMQHIPWYGFSGQARLARDAGVARSTVSRLLSGRSKPSYPLVQSLAMAMERRLGRPLDPRELVSTNGAYPTPSVCDLVGCSGCLPKQAWADDDTLRPAYRGVASGTWSLPNGVSEPVTSPGSRYAGDG